MKTLYIKLNSILTAKQKKQCYFLLLLTVAGSFLELFSASALLPVISLLLDTENMMKNHYIISFCKWLSIPNLAVLIIVFCVMLIVLFYIKNMFLIAILKKRMHTVNSIRFEVSKRVLYSYMHQDYSFHTLTHSSTLLRGMDDDVLGLSNCLNQIFITILEGLTVFLIVGGLLLISPIPTLFLFLFAGSSGYIYLRRQQKRIKRAGEVFSYNMAVARKHALQAFGGIKEILVTRTNDYFTEKCSNSMKERIDSEGEHGISEKAPTYMFELIIISAFLLMLIAVSLLGNDLADLKGQLSAFGVAALRLLPSLGRLNTAWSALVFYRVTIDHVYDTLQNIEELEKIGEEKGIFTPISFEHDIQLKSIWWRYENREDYILKDVDVNIKKGEAIALIGPSGSGKTTLADIMLGLFKPIKGQIMVDDTVVDCGNPAWSSFIGYVPQSAYLLDDTIRNNIAFGEEEAEIDDEYIWALLEKVQLKSFVQSLSQRLDTFIGENGVRISGGQKQRLSIARALYRNPEVLIFDEATSALDTETEAAIMESIDALRGNKTLIIIAHRLTTIQRCDHIYTVAEGTIKEEKNVPV
ncbi:ABC transporter ATP-binding protein [Lachnospiraceae bacterium 54-11]